MLNKTFNTQEVQSQLNSFVDQIESHSNTAIGYIQPELARESVAAVSQTYFDFARVGVKNVATFAEVAAKITEEFTKTFAKK